MLAWVHTRMSDRVIRYMLKPAVFAASLVPVLYWPWAASMQQLNVNPFNAIVRDTGFWSVRFLCLTVALTPLRWLTGWHAFVKFRRMLGLFAFFYAVIHLAAYIAFDALREPLSFTLRAVAADAPRPFFAIGYLSLVLMVPLAVSEARRQARQGNAATPADRFEHADREFFQRVEVGYRALAAAEIDHAVFGE